MNGNNKIVLLEPTVYNKIAAGEVVGRPANVVKELIENSIDAGATEIIVVIKDAGKKLIQVSDNGIGMNEEDAILSVKRHATSKIKNIDDLERIGTFGFRGEALSSIASVSNFIIKTNNNENEVGTIATVSESGEVNLTKDSLPKGTTVIVKNLFYNVPARKNFLKSDKVEFKKIFEVFNFISLAYPEISFKLFRDDKLYADYSSTGLHERMRTIFGKHIIEMTIEFEEQTELASFFGFIAKPTYLTESKNNQHLYVNGRYVKNKTINNAVFSAYENLLTKGEYPFFVMFLQIDPEMVDVNIHPAKEEVKFFNEAEIFSLIKSVVKKALGSFDFIPRLEKNKIDKTNDLKLIINSGKNSNKIMSENKFSGGRVNRNSELDLLFDEIDKDLSKKNNPNIRNKINETENSLTEILFAHKKYLITEIKSGLIIINIHEAHKEILYEESLNTLINGVGFPQQLLFEEKMSFPENLYRILQKFDKKISRLGYVIKYYSNNQISIAGVPSDIKQGREKKTLFAILTALENFSEGDVDKIIAETYSEINAIKVGEKISANELRLIIDKLFALKNPSKTHNGKKIFIKYSLEEINGKFG